jgi:hypothetical protein
MTLDRRHMSVALVLLAGSVIYNVWAFAKPASGTPAEPASPGSAAPVASAPIVSGGTSAAVNPPGITHVADVALDRPPVWSRNPFAGQVPVPEPVVTAPPPAVEPDVIVNSILYSDTRKLAIVNGRRVRIGDRVGSATVADILRDGIVLQSPNGAVRTVERRRAPAARVNK